VGRKKETNNPIISEAPIKNEEKIDSDQVCEDKPNTINTSSIKPSEEVMSRSIPELKVWNCPSDDQYFVYENEVVKALYEKKLGLNEGTALPIFYIRKNHYKDRMDDVVKHINYFLNFYDEDKELFLSTLSVKFIIDQKPALTQECFRNLVMDRIITNSLVSKIKRMAHDLYKININSDKEGKFKTTPKITNIQATQLVALSFCFRLTLPLCVHFSNINESFVGKKDYIPCFDALYMRIIKKFEENDVHIFNALCRFVEYRVDRYYSANKGIWNQKKQLYGITKGIYQEELIHDVLLVKSLHKLDYTRSCVSFIDGIIHYFNQNNSSENYKSKPFEIGADDSMSDSDDYLSHAEALEMSVYKLDESNVLIDAINNTQVMKRIEDNFNIDITPEEFNFYMNNIKINPIIESLLHSFYSRRFKDTNAIYGLTRAQTIELIIYMKKYFQLRGMIVLPQICTANIKGRFKENSIKNSKFLDKLENSSVYQNIIASKFKYISALDEKEHTILKKLSAIINSTFEFVDFDPNINGTEYLDINVDIIINEFLLFLSII